MTGRYKKNQWRTRHFSHLLRDILTKPELVSWWSSTKMDQDGFGMFYFVSVACVYNDNITVSVNEVWCIWWERCSVCASLHKKDLTLDIKHHLCRNPFYNVVRYLEQQSECLSCKITHFLCWFVHNNWSDPLDQYQSKHENRAAGSLREKLITSVVGDSPGRRLSGRLK